MEEDSPNTGTMTENNGNKYGVCPFLVRDRGEYTSEIECPFRRGRILE